MVTCEAAPTKSEDENVRLKDRGYGKATQHIEAEISVYDSLDFELTVLEALDGLAADANDEATRH